MVSRMPPSHAATAHRCVCVYNQLTGEGGGVHLLAWFGVKGSAPLCSPARSFHLPLPPLKTCMEHVLKSCRLFGSQASLITEFFLHTPGWGISCFGDNLSRLPCAKRQRRSKTCLCKAVKGGSSLVWCIHCHPCKAVNCGQETGLVLHDAQFAQGCYKSAGVCAQAQTFPFKNFCLPLPRCDAKQLHSCVSFSATLLFWCCIADLMQQGFLPCVVGLPRANVCHLGVQVIVFLNECILSRHHHTYTFLHVAVVS